jgi:hypothetical protein
MEDYNTFVNGYDIDSFDYLFDKSLFFFKKLKIKKPQKPAKKSTYKKRLLIAGYKITANHLSRAVAVVKI